MLKWFFIWLGFFGGIALVVWSVGTFSNQEERQCISRGGIWTRVDGSAWDSYYYQCLPPKTITEDTK